MTYLELVQTAMKEAGITGIGAANENIPQTLTGVTGMTARFKDWVAQAWLDIQIEQTESEFRKTWFSTTLRPRFYFDLTGSSPTPVAGLVLTGPQSGATMTVTRVIVTNGGDFGPGTAQGIIEFSNPTGGNPFPRETLQSGGVDVVRFIRYGDWRLSDADEMGDAVVADLEDLWWDTLKLSSTAADSSYRTELPIKFLDFSGFVQRYDLETTPLNTPLVVTETPDDGVRISTWPHPDREYSLQGYYYRDLYELVDDEDVPEGFKQMYHPMIVWRAVSYYGMYESQPIIKQMADQRYVVYKKRLDVESEIRMVFRPMALY